MIGAEGQSGRGKAAKTFPSDAEQRRGNLLVSTNIGPKSFTIHLLPPDGSMKPTEVLSAEYVSYFQGTDIATPKGMQRQPRDYCKKSFVPHGLVAREFTLSRAGSEKTVGFGLTEAGQQYAIAAASVAMTFEDEHDQSLFTIFGSVHTNNPDSESAPLTRAKLLKILAAQTSPVRFTDMSEKTGLNNTTLNETIASLAQLQLVTYESASGRIGRENIVYEWTGRPTTEIEPINHDRTFSDLVVTAMQDLQRARKPISKEAVYTKLPEALRARTNERLVRKRVSRHMSSLLNQDMLRHVKHTRRDQSDLILTDKGRVVVVDFINVLDELVIDDPKALAKANGFTNRIKRNPSRYAQRAAALYYPHSKSTKIREREAIMASLASDIAGYPEGITVSGLVESTPINLNTLKVYIETLKQRGFVEIEIVRGAQIIRPKSK